MDVVLETAVNEWSDTNAVYHSPDDDEEEQSCPEIFEEKIVTFDIFLRNWAIKFNVTQASMKPLLYKLNKEFCCNLPLDPRTLMRMLFIKYCCQELIHVY